MKNVLFSWPQFLEEVVRNMSTYTKTFFINVSLFLQVLRDLGFMIPDILHIYLCWMELKDLAKRRGCPPSHLLRDKQVSTAIIMVGVLWFIAVMLPT